MYIITNMSEFINAEEVKKNSYFHESYGVYVLKNREVIEQELTKGSQGRPFADFLVITKDGSIIGQVQTDRYTKTGMISDDLILTAVENYKNDPEVAKIIEGGFTQSNLSFASQKS